MTLPVSTVFKDGTWTDPVSGDLLLFWGERFVDICVCGSPR